MGDLVVSTSSVETITAEQTNRVLGANAVAGAGAGTDNGAANEGKNSGASSPS